MLKELFDQILQLKRPEHTVISTFGNYTGATKEEATYSDAQKEYEIRTYKQNNYEVRSIGAFIAYIKEELSRRDNPDGVYATAKITLDGGNFIADENYNAGKCTYQRLNSEQYIILQNYKDKVLDHEQFLTMLQKLKPSITGFAELYTRCSKIRVIGRSEMKSQPMFDDDGNADSSFICTYKLQDGTDEDVSLPANFECIIPFAKAGNTTYVYNVELLFFNTNSNQIAVKIQVPCWETNEEKAVIDEAEYTKNELAAIPKLLVLADF